jgi:guanylate kinase
MKNIIIISGASGSGKDSVIAGLKQRLPSLTETPTYTTRLPRPGEEAKGDRIFISPSRFNQLFKAGEILEKNFYNGNWFGASKKALEKVLNSNKIPVLEIDVNGFKSFKRLYGERVIGIFIFTNQSDLRKRLKKRGDVSEKQIEARLKISRAENRQSQAFDLKVENRQGQLDKTIDKIIDFLGNKGII